MCFAFKCNGIYFLLFILYTKPFVAVYNLEIK